MINELDLFWVPDFIALKYIFTSGTKFSRNKGIDTCFNVKCMLLGCNFDFLGGFLVVTARYFVVTAYYLMVTARYRSFLLCSFPAFSMSDSKHLYPIRSVAIKQINEFNYSYKSGIFSTKRSLYFFTNNLMEDNSLICFGTSFQNLIALVD